MCDFKPGDEVVCVHTDELSVHYLRLGEIYTVTALINHGHHAPCFSCNSRVSVEVKVQGVVMPLGEHLCACAFRKVHRRDLGAWLKTAATNTDKWDKPIKTPARPKVDALLKRVQSGEFG